MKFILPPLLLFLCFTFHACSEIPLPDYTLKSNGEIQPFIEAGEKRNLTEKEVNQAEKLLLDDLSRFEHVNLFPEEVEKEEAEIDRLLAKDTWNKKDKEDAFSTFHSVLEIGQKTLLSFIGDYLRKIVEGPIKSFHKKITNTKPYEERKKSLVNQLIKLYQNNVDIKKIEHFTSYLQDIEENERAKRLHIKCVQRKYRLVYGEMKVIARRERMVQNGLKAFIKKAKENGRDFNEEDRDHSFIPSPELLEKLKEQKKLAMKLNSKSPAGIIIALHISVDWVKDIWY